MAKPVLAKLELHGFKSIKAMPSLSLGRMNVLIGANGAGKSNFISFFKLLNWMTTSPGNLQFYVSKAGGAHALLHDGPEITPQIAAGLQFETDMGSNEYYLRLFHAAQDTLIFAEEKFRFSNKKFPTKANWISLGSGHREGWLNEYSLSELWEKNVIGGRPSR